MKTSVNVKVQTGFFERTDFKLKAAAEGLTFTPAEKDGAAISIPAARIRSIIFHEVRLRVEILADGLTEAYFANADDWLDALKTAKETLGMKIVCEMKQKKNL